GITRGCSKRLFERADALIRHVPVERTREVIGGLADQIRFCNARKAMSERRDPAFLRQPTGNPVDIARPGSECLLAGVSVRRLAIVDEQHFASAAHLLHAMRQAWECAEGNDMIG